jgi:heptosyltransferase-2
MAVNTPAVALFGPTDPRQHDWPSSARVVALKLVCQPCSAHGHQRCPETHHRCMQELSLEQVLDAIQQVWRASKVGMRS